MRGAKICKRFVKKLSCAILEFHKNVAYRYGCANKKAGKAGKVGKVGKGEREGGGCKNGEGNGGEEYDIRDCKEK